MVASLVDATVKGFPTPSVPKNSDNTNYVSIKEIHQLLTVNATLVGNNLGGGQNGYLGVFLIPEQYGCISSTAFVRPPNLGIMVTVPAWTPNGDYKHLFQ